MRFQSYSTQKFSPIIFNLYMTHDCVECNMRVIGARFDLERPFENYWQISSKWPSFWHSLGARQTFWSSKWERNEIIRSRRKIFDFEFHRLHDSKLHEKSISLGFRPIRPRFGLEISKKRSKAVLAPEKHASKFQLNSHKMISVSPEKFGGSKIPGHSWNT